MGAKRSQTTADVIRYMRANANIGVHYTDVATAVHAPKTAVNNSLTRLVTMRPEMGIRRIGMGQYIFKPEFQLSPDTLKTKPEPEPAQELPPSYAIYEEVGKTQDGTIIVRDEGGTLFKLSDKL